MKKFLYFILITLVAVLPASLTSCSETNDEDTEFLNWQTRNDAYFATIYSKATAATANGDSSWKIIRSYTKSATSTDINDNIVVKVINEGSGTECPLFTDSVKVHYRGYLMPSASYNTTVSAYGSDLPVGYKFDSSWTGDYNINTMMPYSATPSGFITGFATALQKMKNGDRWLVFVPYSLGYSSTAKTGIPAYSTLIFDITLVKSWKKRVK